MGDESNNGGGETHHFVLIHGASHGAWCWYKLRSLIQNSGHRVTCVDLKSSGIDQSDPNQVLTLNQYNQPLIALMCSLPPDEKVVLVGHSAGGLSVTDMIYRFSEKIHLAVYVAANMLKYGFYTQQDVKDAVPDLSKYGDVNEVTYGLGPDQPPTSIIIKPQFQREILYNTSPIEDTVLASMLLRPAPVRAFRGAKLEDGPDVDSVPRVYIKTLYDNVVSLEQQNAMIFRWPPSQVYVLEGDHSPFFSNPSALYEILVVAIALL